jgi:hypothetical protein
MRFSAIRRLARRRFGSDSPAAGKRGSRNVWEWTSDWYVERSRESEDSQVIKGGSYLCSDTYCLRDRSAGST